MSAEKALDMGAAFSERPETAEAPGNLLEQIAEAQPENALKEDISRGALGTFGTRSGRVLSLSGRTAMVSMRGFKNSVEVEIGAGVESDLIADAMHDGDQVLIEFCEGEKPWIVGVLQTKRPQKIRLKAATVEIEGEEEILFRSGKGALRIRSDGDVELVGSRISAASRGLFRIVGRMLRLN